MENHIIDADLISVWNNGSHISAAKCKVDLETKQIFDIGENRNLPEFLKSLDGKFVFIGGGSYPVYPVEELDELTPEQKAEVHFWYDDY